MDPFQEDTQQEDIEKIALLPAAPGKLSVAYHAGPPSIGFFGREWQRDVAQPVTAEEWKAMQARGDFGEFNFTKEK